MMKIAFLGGGKIGRAMIEHVREKKNGEIEFVYDPFIKETEVCGVKAVSYTHRVLWGIWGKNGRRAR